MPQKNNLLSFGEEADHPPSFPLHEARWPYRRTLLRRARHRRLAAWSLVLAAMTAIVMLPVCKTSPEAANAAVQLTHVSQQLADDYADLSNQIDDTVALNEIHAEMLALAFDDSDRNQQNTTKLEADQRCRHGEGNEHSRQGLCRARRLQVGGIDWKCGFARSGESRDDE